MRPGRKGVEGVIYLQLFWEFCKVGLFSVGGGLATIPFLSDLGSRTGWFTAGDLADMIAVSESTPGPLGVNTATYVGFRCGGLLGGVVATLGLIFPSIVIILVISKFLQRFRTSRGVEGVFYGLRPASTGLIAAALAEVVSIALLTLPAGEGEKLTFHLPAIALCAVVFILMKFTPAKKLHPIVFIALSAVAGIVFQM